MAVDEGMATRIRECLHEQVSWTEKRMFGGLCFLVNGNMCCGLLDDNLMARVGPHAYPDALTQPGARPMDFTGRPMTGIVFVDAGVLAEDAALSQWLARCLAFCTSLPPKQGYSAAP